MKSLNKIFRLSFLLLATFSVTTKSYSQCPVTAFANPATVFCGEPVTLTAVADGCKPLNNNFESGTLGTDWAATNGAVVQNGTGTYACVGPAPQGTYSMWMGTNVGAPREVRTNPLDLMQCGGNSGTICFYLKYGVQATASPCEGIELPAEGVYIEYSINGGASWNNIQYYDPNGGYDPNMTSWKRYCLNIPAAAFTTATIFRWVQKANDGPGFDGWGLDDMVITINAPGYTFDWTHDGISPSSTPATPTVNPTATTTYTVNYGNGIANCSSTVTVNVINLTLSATASPTTICAGQPVQLNAVTPASPTFVCGVPTTTACDPTNTIAVEKQVGAGTTLSQTGNPGIGYLGASNFNGAVRSQFLLKATDLIAAGLSTGKFTSMQFDVASNDLGSTSRQNFTISFVCTNLTALPDNYVTMTGATNVFTPKTVTITTGWQNIFFDNGFNWDGTSNILINMCWSLPQGASSATVRTRHYSTGYVATTTDGTNTAGGGSWDCNDDADPFTTGYSSLPNFKFGMCTGKTFNIAYSWSSAPTGFSSTIKNPVANPTTSTTYTVTMNQVGYPAGCALTASVPISVVSPTVSIAPNPASVCSASPSVNLTGTVTANTTARVNRTFSDDPNPNTAIPDASPGAPATRTIAVSGINPNTVAASPIVSVRVNITHPNDGDLVIRLISPAGTQYVLSNQRGGTGDNYTNTVFTAVASDPLISTGAAPFTGNFRPETAFSTITGAVNGNWQLSVQDMTKPAIGSSAGTINDWAITFLTDNGIMTYLWTPPTNLTSTNTPNTTASPTTTTTYTLTATDYAGCSASAPVTVNVTTSTTPTFTPLTAVCQGGTAPTLPTTSNNAITGTWNAAPSTATAGTTTFTFTPAAGQCANTTTISFTVNTPTVPTFTTPTAVCQGAAPPALPASSNNSINGTWNPTSFSTATAGTSTSTFTPAAGQCATTATLSLTVNAPVAPTFTTPAAVCQGATPPALPASSDNGFAGTWNPTTFNTASAGTSTSTFTPNAGVCATTGTLSLTVNPPTPPTFTPPASVCQGATPPALPASSDNGFAGTWNPTSFSTASVGTSTCTFTPNAGVCATTGTLSLTVTAPPTPTFPIPAAVCQGATPPALPASSNEGITGTWNPTTFSTASPGTSTSTFTPSAGACSTTATLSLTVNTPVTPTFAVIPPLCVGDPAPSLPASSNEGIAGTWNPATISTASAGTFTHTFTPSGGVCATTATLSVTVGPPATPTFTAPAAVCQGATPPALPATSNEGIAGTWNPTTFSTASSGTSTSTFTPSGGACATTATLSLTVDPPVTPTFPAPAAVCQGATPPALPASSNEGIAGTWNPTTFSTATSGTSTSTFTPSGGACATTATLSLTVDPPVTPTFPATTPVCEGGTPPALPASSNEGIAGTWNPTTFSTATAGTFVSTFTPSGGACATTATLSLTVNPLVTPTFDIPAAVCQGATPPALPASSNEGIAGTWNPAAFSTATAGTSTCTFTPSGGACATTATSSLTVDAPVTPTFNPIPPMCVGDPAPALPASSNEGIAGTWNPATITTGSAGTTTYTFTPGAGICATTASISVTVGPPATPTFTQAGPYCSGDVIPALPTTSIEGITGSWAPALNNTTTTTYTFNPSAGACATTASMTITIDQPVTPTFAAVGPYCVGETVPALPTSSAEAITGTWNPAIDNTATTVYTFTPDGGQCATTASTTIIINPSTMPTFTTPAPFCEGTAAPLLPSTSDNSINGTWAPATVDNMASNTYTFTPAAGQCASSMTMSITVNPTPTITVADVTTCANTDVGMSASGAANYDWSPATGLSATTGTSVTANLPGPGPYTYTITGTDGNGCVGTTTADVIIAAGLTINATPPSANLCSGGSVDIICNGATTYTWSPATGLNTTTGATVTANPSVTTTYTVDGESSGCTGQTTIVVTVGSQITPTFTPVPDICSGSTAPVLQAPSIEGINGTWTPAVVDNTASGTYTFTPAAGECATSASINITVNPAPSVVSVTEVCDGTNTSYVVTVTLSGGSGSYTMTENAPGSIGGTFAGSTWTSNPIPSGTAYDFDFLDASSGCGPAKAAGMKNCNCSTNVGTMSSTLISLCGPLPASPVYDPAGEVQDADDVQSYVLHTSAGGTIGTVMQSNTSGTFTFAPPMVYGTTYYISAVVGNDSGSGQVDLTDPCLAAATGTPVVWNQAPTATPSSNSPLCEGATLDLTGNAVAGGTYQWTGPLGYSNTQQSPSILNVTTGHAGVYTLVVTANGCPSPAATTTVVINAPTAATFNPIGAICQGAAAPGLPTTSSNGFNGSWAPSFVNTSTVGTQTFTFTPTAGQCATSTTLSVTVNPLPVPSATSASTCPNAPVILNASGGTNYTWSPGTGLSSTTGSSVTATLSASQTYNVLVTDANGCQATTTSTVTMSPGLNITVIPASATICAGQSVSLTASGAATYSWTPASGLDNPNAATVNASPAGTQVYTVTGNTSGCTGTANVTVTVNPVPVMTAIADITQCDATSVSAVNFTSNPAGATFGWSNNNPAVGLAAFGTGTSTPAFTGNTGIGTVDVVPVLNGCTGAPETFTITINSNPVPSITTNTPVCESGTLNLTAQPNGLNYNWNGPGGFGNTNQNPSISPMGLNQAGNYTLVVVDANGCTGSDVETVTVNPLPQPTIGPAGPFCIDDNTPANLVPSIAGGTFSGNGITNGAAGTFVPSSVGSSGSTTITYTVTDGNGCTGSGTSAILINPLPPVNPSGVPLTGCSPLIVTFNGETGMSSSVWSFGDGSSATDFGTGTIVHTYTGTGSYDVTLTNTLDGCTNTTTLTDYITVAPDPVADFSVRDFELEVYDPTVVITNRSTGASTYSWTFGDGTGTSTAVDPTYTYPSSPATYTIDLVATSVDGCTDEASLTIIVKDRLVFWVPNTFTPDGDELNNTFRPVFTSGFDPYDFTMFIFNRWGEIVFESHDVTMGWDGTYNGELAPEGVYTWTMQIKDPQTDELTRKEGHIQLLR